MAPTSSSPQKNMGRRNSRSAVSEQRRQERQQVNDDELRQMGDWDTQALEWDQTDITLSTADGLAWLQSLNIVDTTLKASEMTGPQREAVNALIQKIKTVPTLSSQFKHMTKEQVEENADLTQEMGFVQVAFRQPATTATSSAARSGSRPTSGVSTAASYPTNMAAIRTKLNRLRSAWGHYLDEAKAQQIIEQSAKEVMQMTHHRLLEELAALRMENTVLRERGGSTEVIQASMKSQDVFISSLKMQLGSLESQVLVLQEQISQKNQELAVLRSIRDLSVSNTLENPRLVMLGTSTSVAKARGNPPTEELIHNRARVDAALARRNVPSEGWEDTWRYAQSVADKGRIHQYSVRQVASQETDTAGLYDSPLANRFVI